MHNLLEPHNGIGMDPNSLPVLTVDLQTHYRKHAGAGVLNSSSTAYQTPTIEKGTSTLV